MENRNILVKCYKCGDKYTTDQMRHDPNKPGTLVCKNCLSKKSIKTTTEDLKSKKEETIRYYCVKCNYKFTRKKGAEVLACPYCGREDTLTTKIDASSLLKNADSDTF